MCILMLVCVCVCVGGGGGGRNFLLLVTYPLPCNSSSLVLPPTPTPILDGEIVKLMVYLHRVPVVAQDTWVSYEKWFVAFHGTCVYPCFWLSSTITSSIWITDWKLSLIQWTLFQVPQKHKSLGTRHPVCDLLTASDHQWSFLVKRVRNKSMEKKFGIQLGFEPKTFWVLVRHSYH